MSEYENYQNLVELYKELNGKDSEFPQLEFYDILDFEFQLECIFPTSVKVAKEVDYNVGYHAKECDAEHFLMRKCMVGEIAKYILFTFSLQASGGSEMDLEIFSMDYQFYKEENMYENFVDKTVQVVDFALIGAVDLIKRYRLTRLDTIASIFKEIHPNEWEEKLLAYVNSADEDEKC